MNRNTLFYSFFLIFFAFLLYEFAQLIAPFLTPILGAVVLLILAYPIHERIGRLMRHRSAGLQALLSTIIVVALIVGPLIAVSWFLISESQSMVPMLQHWGQTLESWRHGTTLLHTSWMRSIEARWPLWLGGLGRFDVERILLQWGSQLFSWMGAFGQSLATNTILSIGSLAILVFTLFFFFRDGETMLNQARRLIPMRAHDQDRLVEKLKLIVTEIVRGSILTGLCQMACATLGYGLARVPAPLTFGLLTGIASFIPVVGSALVWVPMGVFLLARASYGRGIFILLWGILVISVLDNLLRTFFIGRKAKLSTLFLFFGIIGGAELYGVKGVLIGPVLVAILPVFFDIFSDLYLRKDTPEAK
ncbi:MAG: AI-2E family transporter [Elusimicrobiota bacterium]|jgi:predicted PurR-regulated permease PerM